MSDQARPAEIEDVLSSIRRLVSGDAQAETQADPNPQTQSAATAASEDDALVLTPSLRVPEDEGAASAHRAWDEDAAADSDASSEQGEGAPPLGETARDEEDASASDAAPELEETATEAFVAGPAENGEADLHGSASDAADVLPTEAAEQGPSPAQAESEHRKSPFLPDSLIAQRAAEGETAAPPSETRRSGFGFAGARREDPVRHVPLSDLAPAEPATAPRDSERTLHLSVATDAEEATSGETAPSEIGAGETAAGETAEAPEAAAAAVISPGFAVGNVPEDASGAQDSADESGAVAHGDPEPSPPVDGSGEQAQSTEQEADVTELESSDVAAQEDAPLPESGESAAAVEEALETEQDVSAAAHAPDDAVHVAQHEDEEAPDALDPQGALAQDDTPDQEATAEEASAESQDETAAEVDFLPDEDETAPAEQAPETGADGPADAGPSEEAQATTIPTRAEGEHDPDSTAPTALNVFGESGPMLDEEALRALVSDVVYRELQGALGERVSHNIRLLVRREVAKALQDRLDVSSD